MKKLYIISYFLLCISPIFSSSLKTDLSGIITDKGTGEPLTGVTVYIPDLKIGTITNIDGYYKIENLPKIKTLIQISMVGYRTFIETIDLSSVTIKDFALEYVATELNEIVITGLTKAAEQKRTPTPISIVPKKELLQHSSANIINAIALQPGISEITTGIGISKPVIRGLGYNRVITLHDGIRQEGQQWGGEHGIEIDEYDVYKVEILKGPASLAYGSDAIAGIINILPEPTLPENKIAGNILGNYQTNNGLIGYSLNIKGNRKGLIWDVRYSNKMAHAYKNKYDGYVFNSGFNENAISWLIGINRSWGYSHLKLSSYNITPGIVEGDRDSTSGKFIKISNSGEESIASENDFTSYKQNNIPFQKIFHYKAVLNNNIVVGNGNLITTFGFQQNQRREYGENSSEYGLYFLLNTFSYDIRYNLPEFNNFEISFGTNGMKQLSFNKGHEYLVPEYDLFDLGIFLVAKKRSGQFDFTGGIRYDRRTQNGKSLFLNSDGEKVENPLPGDLQRFASFHSIFSGFSGSIGATWQISKTVYTKFNISRGFRAPNIGEIGSNGTHEGTLRYEIGDPNLNPEYTLQFDYTLGLSTEHVSAEANAFYSSIDNFIYLRKLNTTTGHDSIIDGNAAFKFFSGNANLLGGEIRCDIHPHPYDWLHFENSLSYVQSQQENQPDSTRYLPFTPAPKWISTIQTDIKKINSWLSNFYIKFTVVNYFPQNKFYSAYGTETKTPGYTLLNFGIGTDIIKTNKTLCSAYISVNNITDKTYQSHLSRLKYAPKNYKNGRTGVYNIGRNISFKLIIPLNLK